MTTYIKNILPREEMDPEVLKLLGKFSSGIEAAVNFGTHILAWDIKQAKGKDENIPVILMFRHILELLDSISILIKVSSVDPCKLILRGILETFLGLEYLLEKDTTERALGFLVWHYHKDLKQYKKFDPRENESKNLERILQSDKSLDGMTLPKIPNLEKAITNINKLLLNPIYSNSEAKYRMLLSSKESNPSWYRVSGGPKNVEQLAIYLKRQALYEILYRNWSGPAHGTDIMINKMGLRPDGHPEFVQIRYAKDAQTVTQLGFSLALMSFRLMVEKRITNRKEEYGKWYLTVREFYLKITKEKLLNVE